MVAETKSAMEGLLMNIACFGKAQLCPDYLVRAKCRARIATFILEIAHEKTN